MPGQLNGALADYGDIALNSGGYTGGADAKWHKASIHLREGEGDLAILLQGHWYADLLLEELGPVVRSTSRSGTLVLDFSDTLGLDDLALSAVVVLLRTYCRSYNSITLRLHQPWALARLMEHGARRVLGPAWAAGFETGLVRFTHRDM